MLKNLAIDLLLRWALCVELPKGEPVEASAWELMARAAVVRVTGAAGGGGLGFVPGEPHADATALAAAVRRLPKAYRLGADRVAQLVGDYAVLDHAAIEAVGGAPFNLAALVIRGAILSAFDWDIGEPTPQPMRRESNDLPIVFGTDRKSGALSVAVSDRKTRRYPPHLTDLHCPVLWGDPSVGQLAETRAEYAAWHDALLMVMVEAQPLSEYRADTPSVGAMPWQVSRADAPRVLAARAIAPTLAPLPLSPRRAPAAAPLRRRPTLDPVRDAAKNQHASKSL